jgi:branched-chain amino acid transport system ATP-binding protein
MEILKTESLVKNFGGLRAIDQVNFRLEEGQLQSIIGPNGAGKSTFFKLITGELHPDRGGIWFRGEDITGLPQYAVSHRGMSVAYQLTNIFPKLTTLENIRVAMQSRKTTYNFWSRKEALPGLREKSESILKTVELASKKDELACNLSHGEQRHLEMGIALATDPVLLLLDEPTAGMSPEDTERTIQLIRAIARGRTIILVEHKMKVVMKISDKITVLHDGRILAEGKPEEIQANERVQEVYLKGR